jgi:hypothetical protein
MRLFLILLLGGAVLAGPEAAGSPMLNRAAEKWLAEGNHWAFTVRVREFDEGEVKEDRVEHYDPSKPGADRWELVTVDGRAPTEVRRQTWLKYKTKHRRGVLPVLADYFDFENARVAEVTASAVRYHLPLRSNHSWLFPVDRVALMVTVNKTTQAIEQVEAGLDEPYRVALGLARVLDVDFDLKMNAPGQSGGAGGPAMAQPQGLARVVVSRLGARVEYNWSDFRRVTPHPDSVAGQKPDA